MDRLTPTQAAHLDRVVDWLTGVKMADLMKFVGAQEAADAIGISKGGLTYHFSSMEKLREQIVERATDRFDDPADGWSYQSLMASVHGFLSGEVMDRDVARAVAVQVGRYSAGHDTDKSPEQERCQRLAAPVALVELLLTVAAPNDPKARDLIRKRTAHVRSGYMQLIDPVMTSTRRRWRDDFTAESFATVTQALSEGFMLLRRIDSKVAPLDLYAASWMTLLLGCTYDPADPSDLEVSSFIAQMDKGVPDVPFERVCDAAWTIVRQGGPDDISAEGVARLAEMEIGSVYRLAPRHRDLQAAAFRGGIAADCRRTSLVDARGNGAASRYVELLFGFACDRPRLSEAFRTVTVPVDRAPRGIYDPHSHIHELLGRDVDDVWVEAAVAALLTVAKGGCTSTLSEAVAPIKPLLGLT